MARDGEHLTSLLGGKPRGDEGARAARRLHDDDSKRYTRDQAVAAREILGARLETRRISVRRQPLRRSAASAACSGG